MEITTRVSLLLKSSGVLVIRMSGCHKCKAELTQEDLKFKLVCDHCRCKYCLPCSKLSSTEQRCMGLGKRILRFYCESCDNHQSRLMDKVIQCNESHQSQLMKNITANMELLFEAKMETFREETAAHISSLNQQVSDLVDTNKELIKLLKPVPVGSVDQSSPQDLAREAESIVSTQPSTVLQSATGNRQQSEGTSKKPEDIPTGRFTNRKNSASVDQQRNFVRGTLPTPPVALGSGQENFAAVARRAYLYVGNVNPNANKNTIVEYIRSKASVSDFTVDELPKRDEALSRAYKLTIDFTLLDVFNRADFWPQGIIIKRFFRPRGRHQ